MNTFVQDEARALAQAMPLDAIDVSKPRLFKSDTIWPFFERLRREDPVHFCKASANGPYWSVTRFKDIMKVDTSHGIFSSASGIGIANTPDFLPAGGFISMDPPEHDEQRKAVQPIVAPPNLVNFEPLIRSRTATILDSLPIDQPFNWVQEVSVALTTQMLATLFDFPFEDRKLLTHWSDVATTELKAPDSPIKSEDERKAELAKCVTYFMRLWNERIKRPPASDLISMMAHAPATRNMNQDELLGNLVLLIVGGNDTTRNSMTGSVYWLNQFPDQYQKLRENPGLITNMVSEVIRYQTPLAHMRRTALVDTELAGKQIKKGDKVVMWYISGNRDDEVIANPNDFIIDRPNARQHLSFGFGIHRCVGNRLAELQLKVVWEEIMKRFSNIEVLEPPVRSYSNFVHGYTELITRIPASAVLKR